MSRLSVNRLSMSAAILAGGRGSRLEPAIGALPKVLAPVGGRPFITILLDQLAAAGIEHVVLLVGYRAAEVRRTLSARWKGMRLEYSVEVSPLGTGGALRQALPLTDGENMLLLNGDSYCDVDLGGLVDFHRERRAAATLTIAHVGDGGRFGRVGTTRNGGVTAFAEKQAGKDAGWINAGVYAFARSLIEEVPAAACSLEKDCLPVWTRRGCLHAYRGGSFLDIGTPESYAAAEEFFQIEGRAVRRRRYDPARRCHART